MINRGTSLPASINHALRTFKTEPSVRHQRTIDHETNPVPGFARLCDFMLPGMLQERNRQANPCGGGESKLEKERRFAAACWMRWVQKVTHHLRLWHRGRLHIGKLHCPKFLSAQPDERNAICMIDWRGNPARCLEAWVSGAYALAVSHPILSEYEEVIGRLAVLYPAKQPTDWLSAIQHAAHL
jgi:hypothetical protein